MMQTLYFTTRNFIRHEGNVVDLAEYRTRLQACSGFEAVPVSEEDTFWPCADEDRFYEEEEAPRPLRAVERRERRQLLSLLRLPDLCATLAIVVMAVAVVARFIQL